MHRLDEWIHRWRGQGDLLRLQDPRRASLTHSRAEYAVCNALKSQVSHQHCPCYSSLIVITVLILILILILIFIRYLLTALKFELTPKLG